MRSVNIKEVEAFLQDFKMKKKIWGVLFLAREKNFNTLSTLEISGKYREDILESLTVSDYVEGPMPEEWHGSKEMWVFGKVVKSVPIYIKITLGTSGDQAICISFHIAEYPLSYPLESK